MEKKRRGEDSGNYFDDRLLLNPLEYVVGSITTPAIKSSARKAHLIDRLKLKLIISGEHLASYPLLLRSTARVDLGMSDAFPNHLLHLSTLLLLSRSTPFTHAHSSSISTLSHLLQQYLETLASSSLQYANHSGRDKVSVWDLGNAIEDLQGRTSLNGLNDELEKADEGVEEEADGLRELAKNLQGTTRTLSLYPEVRD